MTTSDAPAATVMPAVPGCAFMKPKKPGEASTVIAWVAYFTPGWQVDAKPKTSFLNSRFSCPSVLGSGRQFTVVGFLNRRACLTSFLDREKTLQPANSRKQPAERSEEIIQRCRTLL